jgi:hypothetical protein
MHRVPDLVQDMLIGWSRRTCVMRDNPSLCHNDTIYQFPPGGDFEVERMFEMRCRSSNRKVFVRDSLCLIAYCSK